ncbi:ATP-binding protein [Pseudonocardia acaciae]|uniref:ATP-binding protein n=1 Tax=Pseudonocardia acaciae TaxID=551276 RepID=UPI0012ECE930|nr:ATP-binding protein [Pseudonocardia acaciae]
MPDVLTEIRIWIPVIAVALTAIGLPKILADRRERKAKATEESGPATLLPAPVTLVDRVAELAQILGYMASGEPIITVEGGRGVGKSALVLVAAHRFAATGNRRGKVAKHAALFWIDAQNACPDLPDLARKLGLHSGVRSLTTAPAEKAHAIRSYLAANPTVFVVDNLRLRSDEPAPLRELFEMLPSGSRAIISSNTVGVLSGPRVTVTELPREDARALVVREAERSKVDGLSAADESIMARVHRLVGGNPRAIRLFVTACAGQPGTVAELLDEIESGAGGMDTLYGVIWTELSADARAALATCALLVSGADLSQVAIALARPEPDTKLALRRLWIDGLVESARRSAARSTDARRPCADSSSTTPTPSDRIKPAPASPGRWRSGSAETGRTPPGRRPMSKRSGRSSRTWPTTASTGCVSICSPPCTTSCSPSACSMIGSRWVGWLSARPARPGWSRSSRSRSRWCPRHTRSGVRMPRPRAPRRPVWRSRAERARRGRSPGNCAVKVSGSTGRAWPERRWTSCCRRMPSAWPGRPAIPTP